jgi:hypothetical protein
MRLAKKLDWKGLKVRVYRNNPCTEDNLKNVTWNAVPSVPLSEFPYAMNIACIRSDMCLLTKGSHFQHLLQIQLTYSIEQSPSGESNRSAAGQEITHIL